MAPPSTVTSLEDGRRGFTRSPASAALHQRYRLNHSLNTVHSPHFTSVHFHPCTTTPSCGRLPLVYCMFFTDTFGSYHSSLSLSFYPQTFIPLYSPLFLPLLYHLFFFFSSSCNFKNRRWASEAHVIFLTAAVPWAASIYSITLTCSLGSNPFPITLFLRNEASSHYSP